MNSFHLLTVKQRAGLCGMVLGAGLAMVAGTGAMAQTMLPNACPVDGCEVKIVSVTKSGDELELTLESNFTPDVSRNHFHVWWGESYTVEQVSNNAETSYNIKQGDWHPTGDYPSYVTQSGASVSVRNGARTICVTAADRNHDILDPKIYQCMDVGDHL